MGSYNINNKRSPGTRSPFNSYNPDNIVTNHDPATDDIAEPSTSWTNKLNNTQWFCTSVTLGRANWANVSGGSGSFASLNVPGNVVLGYAGTTTNLIGNSNSGSSTFIFSGTGNTTISSAGNISISTSDGNIIISSSGIHSLLMEGLDIVLASTGNIGTITIGAATNEGQILIGQAGLGLSQSISLGSTAGDYSINIATGTGSNGVLIGNHLAGSNVQILADTTGSQPEAISIDAGGYVAMTPGTVSNNSYDAILDTRVGHVVLTGLTLSSGLSQVITITNTLCTANSCLFVTIANLGNSSAFLTLVRVQPFAGSFEVTVTNNGTQALNGDIHINFWITN